MSLRLSVQVDRETATAARNLRNWLNLPGGSDLCSGGEALDVATLERIAVATNNLNTRLQLLVLHARGPAPFSEV